MDGKPSGKWWVSGPPSRSPGRDVLIDQYVTKGMSLRQMAPLYGVAPKTIGLWLRAAGIERRPAVGQKGQTYRPTDSHRQKLRENATRAREQITLEAQARSAANRRGQPAWNKGKPLSAEHRQKLWEMRQDPEYRRRQSERQRGEKSNNWRGGTTDVETLRMHGWEWRRRAAECYARDGWTCCDCGVKCLGGKDARREPHRRIQAHHVVRRRDGGLDDLDNLVTLCLRCHTIRERASDGALFA